MLKSREAKHEVQFSEVGARIMSVEFADEDPFDGAPLNWGRRTDRFTLRHIGDVLAAARAGDINGARIASMDLVTASVDDEGIRSDPPQWIRSLREALEESSLAIIDVRDWAVEAGYHPAHVSRLFRRCFGYSISDYASAHAVRRAIGQLASPDVSLSEAALAAGFYDQSHMNRLFRRVLGRTPGEARALLTR